MEHDYLQIQLDNSPTLKLLRSQNAPLIISFLYDQFKHTGRVTISESALTEKLEDYLEAVRETHPDLYPSPAQTYLRQWCDENHRFLRKYHTAESDDPVYELTPDSERAIRWLEDLQKSEFVGTESRFLRIFDLLGEIVTQGSEDVETRLARLEAEKVALQARIDAIRATGEIERYTETQIKERFFEAHDTARRLLADFREVEENFRSLARAVQENQLKVGVRKGHIVGYVLEADAALKESDQGRSFYAFWEFLMSAAKQDELRRLLATVHELPEVQRYGARDQVLRRLKRSLIDAGAKIVESNRRLGEQLRKLLDEQRLAEARRVMALVAEIKQTAVQLVGDPPDTQVCIELEALPEVNMPLEKPLWRPPEEPAFANQVLFSGAADLAEANLDALYNQFYVDEGRLRRKIETLLEGRGEVTLADVVAVYPVEKGLAEIVTYLSIAAKDEGHTIDPSAREDIALAAAEEAGRAVSLPRVVYRRESRAYG